MSKNDTALITLKRIVNYLSGQGIGEGEFGRAAGFTIPRLNQIEYLEDFLTTDDNGQTRFIYNGKYKLSVNNDKIRASLKILIEQGLFKKEKIDGRTFLYFPTVPVSSLADIAEKFQFPVTTQRPRGNQAVGLDPR